MVPEGVRRKARALGPAGERWLDELPSIIGGICSDWDIQVGDAIEGGSGGFVAHAVDGDGVRSVLKLSIPDGLMGHSPFEYELSTLLLGDERCYVRVLRHDVERRAMLQERLGRPLGTLGLPVEAQIDAITSTLRKGWHRPLDRSLLRNGADQAAALEECVAADWNALGRPCDERVIERAVQYARSRRQAYDDERAVLIHGDAHPANVLENGTQFKLIDPDGMFSEPAHDLAIPLRDWTDELLAGDAAPLAVSWCEQLGARAGVDPAPIWEWAYLERVSTGLFLLRLGDELGARFLVVADLLWSVSAPAGN